MHDPFILDEEDASNTVTFPWGFRFGIFRKVNNDLFEKLIQKK